MRHKHTRATRASHCFRRCHHCQHYHLLRIAIWIVLSGCELWVKEWHGFKIENYSLFHRKSSSSSTLRSFCSTFSIYSLCVAMWARHCCLELYWSTRASITQRVIVKSVELLWFCENRMIAQELTHARVHTSIWIGAKMWRKYFGRHSNYAK